MAANRKTSLVWGTLPGTTDENIHVTAHRDGWFDAATDNAAFTVTPRAMRIPPDGSAAFRISYQANDDRKATAQLKFSSDDPANTERGGYLVANQPGVGIGRPLPEITVDLVDGGRWSSTALKGHVALLAYFATF